MIFAYGSVIPVYSSNESSFGLEVWRTCISKGCW